VEELEGLLVGPVQVVGDQQQRPGRGQHRPGERLEQQPPLVGAGRRLGRERAGRRLAHLREDADELAQVRRVEPSQVPGQRVGTEP
jgi:hypothetical protein